MKCLAIAFSLAAVAIVMLDWRFMPDFFTSLAWPLVLGVTLVAPWLPRLRCLGFAWLLALAGWMCPYDISTINVPGPPRFIPLVMGMPTQLTYEAAERGEVLLGGCMVSGYEPKWVLVW